MCLQERIHLEEYWILVEKIIMKMNDRKGNVESCLTGGVLQIHDSRVAGQPLLYFIFLGLADVVQRMSR